MKNILIISLFGVWFLNAQTHSSRPQTPIPPFEYDTEEVSFINSIDKNTLAGTLSTPRNKKNFPILVMITGSGLQNRDEELFGHKPFAVIADYFAKNGIATLRMDDRGVGGSSKGNNTDTTENFATDINAAVNFLAAKGFKNIGLIGHSEGGIIAPIVAEKNKNVKHIILLAAPGIEGSEVLILQNDLVSKLSGFDEKTIQRNREINRKLYDFTKSYTGTHLKEDLKKHIKTELPDSSDISTEQWASALAQPWVKYFLSLNPDVYLNKIKIPILALNGSLDSQVTPKENLDGIRNSLKKAGNKNFEIIEIEGVNHLFQTAQTGSPFEYSSINETFSPKVLKLMKDWILKIKK